MGAFCKAMFYKAIFRPTIIARKKPYLYDKIIPIKKCLVHIVKLDIEKSYDYLEDEWKMDRTGAHDFHVLIFDNASEATELLEKSKKADDFENIATLSEDTKDVYKKH